MSKTLLITGGSSGIGKAICQRFLDANYLVINLDLVPGEFGHFIQCDITDHGKAQEQVKQICATHQIDVLISNAGMHFSADIENTSEDDFDRVFTLNVKGAYSVVQAAIPHMKNNNKGVILFVGSDQSTIAKPNSFIYNLSKHALASMAKTIALDYAKYNIRSNALCPGTIETPLYHKAIDAYCEKTGADPKEIHAQEAAMQPLGRIGQAEDVAAMALFLASDDASFITGSLHAIDGGYTTG